MINEVKIRCFLCVADTLNFTAAGDRMFMTQQAVSKHIANLEEDLGFSLLNRTRNSVSLTPAGLRMHRFFSETKLQFDELLTDIKHEQYHDAVNIRIGYQNWIDFGPAPGRAMSNVRQTTPDLHLIGERHTPARLIELLEAGALDIILLHDRFIPKRSGFFKTELITTPMQVVVSGDASADASGDYMQFCKYPLLIDSFDGEAEADTIQRAEREAERYGFTPERIIIVPNRDSIYTSAELGSGIFFGSSMAQQSSTLSLRRYDTDVTEVLYCVRMRENRFIKLFARELQKEYAALEESFAATRKWS